jgi:flagellar hook assembly protein FlgD
VRVVIYNALGQEIRTLVDGFHGAGVHTVLWDGRDADGRDVSSGVYVYRLEVVGEYVDGRRMTLAR